MGAASLSGGGGGSPLAQPGGRGAAVPLAGLRLFVGWEGRGGGGGGLPAVPLWSPGAALPRLRGGRPDGLGPGGSAVDGGGGALPPHCSATNRALGCRAGPRPLLSPASPRRVALAGGGRGGSTGLGVVPRVSG